MVKCFSTCTAVSLFLAFQGASAQLPSQENRLEKGDAPTPYAASEIRRDCSSGAWRTYQIETLKAAGWKKTQQTTRFVAGGPQVVEISVVDTDAEGRQGETRTISSTWIELQKHASFPDAHTVIELVPVELGVGQFDAWLYSVVDPKTGGEMRLWFATTLAGPPIHMEQWQEGRLIYRMTLLDFGPRP